MPPSTTGACGPGLIPDPQAVSFFDIIAAASSPHSPLSNKAGKQTDTDCHDDELHQGLSHHRNRCHPHGIGQCQGQRQNHQRVTGGPGEGESQALLTPW